MLPEIALDAMRIGEIELDPVRRTVRNPVVWFTLHRKSSSASAPEEARERPRASAIFINSILLRILLRKQINHGTSKGIIIDSNGHQRCVLIAMNCLSRESTSSSERSRKHQEISGINDAGPYFLPFQQERCDRIRWNYQQRPIEDLAREH
jgi:hypothetical protein